MSCNTYIINKVLLYGYFVDTKHKNRNKNESLFRLSSVRLSLADHKYSKSFS
jgi:hypothetical protein